MQKPSGFHGNTYTIRVPFPFLENVPTRTPEIDSSPLTPILLLSPLQFNFIWIFIISTIIAFSIVGAHVYFIFDGRRGFFLLIDRPSMDSIH